MNDGELRTLVIATLQAIAPEVDETDLHLDRPLRRQVDLDSMDWLNFLIALAEKLKVEIPEADYGRLVSVNDLVRYLGGKLRPG